MAMDAPTALMATVLVIVDPSVPVYCALQARSLFQISLFCVTVMPEDAELVSLVGPVSVNRSEGIDCPPVISGLIS